jgi:ribulose-5-phosphate 4-epimerase/fuculose-1-phosphate aldolase
VVANHIIHKNGVVDAFGHISIRHPGKADVFIMSANMAPALVRSTSDFVEYRIADSAPCHTNAPKGFIERFIHSEIYKSYSGVKCVIHSHAEDVLPFAVSGVPLRPMFHMTGFLGACLA